MPPLFALHQALPPEVTGCRVVRIFARRDRIRSAAVRRAGASAARCDHWSNFTQPVLTY
jgi:hypothetical protein